MVSSNEKFAVPFATIYWSIADKNNSSTLFRMIPLPESYLQNLEKAYSK